MQSVVINFSLFVMKLYIMFLNAHFILNAKSVRLECSIHQIEVCTEKWDA